MTTKQALDIASRWELEYEVAYEMAVNKRTPEEALREWDCI